MSLKPPSAGTSPVWIDAADMQWIGGRIFGSGSSDTSTCLRIGDTTTAVFPSRLVVITALGNAQTLVNFNREGGNNKYELTMQTVASGAPVSGLPISTSQAVFIYDNGAGNVSSSIKKQHQYPGSLVLRGAGSGLQIAEESNCTMGASTLVAGTVTVSTTAVTASSRIFLTGQNSSGTHGELTVSARSAGTSFTITSSNAADTRSVAWMIVEPTT